MKINKKKHSIYYKSLVVFLLLNMIACSTIKEDSDSVKLSKSQNVEYSNKNISQMIDKVVNKVVWNDERSLYPTLNIKVQNTSNVDKYHIGKTNYGKAYEANMIQNPQRLVLDLKGVKSLSNKNIFVGTDYVTSLRLGAHSDKTRLVFDLKQAKNLVYDIQSESDGLNLFISNNNETLTSAKNSLADNVNTITQDTTKTDVANVENEVQDEKSLALTNIANNEIKLKDNEETKKSNFDAETSLASNVTTSDTKDNVELKKQAPKSIVSKIHCYEKADKLAVQINVNNNAQYELNKIADNEYSLRLKNTILNNEANKPIALPKTRSVLNSIQTSKDENDTVIKFFVSKNAMLEAKRNKIGIQVSENKTSYNYDKQDLANNNIDLDKATIERDNLDSSKDSLKAQMDLSKLEDSKKDEEAKNDEQQKEESDRNIEGSIEIEDLVSDDKKGTGNIDEKGTDDIEGLDEEISKLLDPASGYTGKLISLDFQDTDIDNALKIIAEVSNLNIVASDDITGKVSLRLNNVPWDQALDVILKTNGLDKVQEGNVVRIAPVNRLKSEREELKAARQAEENLEPLQLAYRKVSYAKAAELQALVETVLSDRGSVTFDDRSNQIFIKDIKPRIKDAFELIKKADLRTPQILLETQIIEAERNLVRELGSEFGFTVIQSNETGNGTGYNFPSNVTVTGSNSPDSNTFSSFPTAAGSAVSFIFDSLDGSKSLQARISGLEDEGKLKVISKPSVVTTNNTPAEIKSVETVHVRLPDSGTTIATGQGSSASGVSKAATESIDAGITLKVTPQASPDYYVLLDIMGESSHFGSRSVDGIPSIIIRRATSTVLVSSGQTFALGGVYKVTDKDTISGVPFLKDIPVLGHFFRRAGVDNSDEELLFFLTPRIVEGSFDDAK